jgi:hypothetical protein
MQNTAANGEYYAFYAAGDAPSKFAGEVIRSATAPVNTNTTAYSISENGNAGNNSFSIDWVFANGGFNPEAQARIAGQREGTTADFSIDFYTQDRPAGSGADADVLERRLSIGPNFTRIESKTYTSLITTNKSAGNVMAFQNDNGVNYYVGMSEALGFQVLDTDGQSYLLTSKSGIHAFYKSGFNNGYQLQIQDDRIRAANDYVPSDDYDLVTKKWVSDNSGGSATLPITNSGNTAGIDFATGGVQPVTYMYSRNSGTGQAGSINVDEKGRVRTLDYANNSASVSENAAFGLYSKVDKGTSRTGFTLRSTFWGDNDGLPSGQYSTINYLYGFYSSPLVRDANLLTSTDFVALGTQCLDNSSVTTQIGFYVSAGYANQAVPPSGQDVVIKYGFRSDLPQVQDSAFNDRNFHILTNGTAPSRFGSDIELSTNGRIVNASYFKDAQLEAFNSSIRVSSSGTTYLPTNASRINNNSIFQIENSKEDTDYVGMSFYNRNVGGTSFSAGLGVRANANGVEGDSTFTITCREGGNTAIQTAAFSNDKVNVWLPLIVDENICARIFTSEANNPGTKTTPGDASVKFNDRVNFRSTNLYQFVPISGSDRNILNFYDSEIEDQVNVFLGTYGSNHTGETQMGIGPAGSILHSNTGILALGTNNVDSKVVIGCGNSSGIVDGPTLTIERDDIYLRSGIIPQTDYSLATKKYVDDATGGGAANVQQGFIVATGTQTDFTIDQGYTSGQMDIYLNGVKMLDNTDYTAGDGSTIVLETPAVSGDIVQVTTYTNLTSLSLTTDDITVPPTSGSSFSIMSNGGVTQTDLNSDFDTRISQTSVCSLADMDCGFFGGDGSQFNQPSKNPIGWVLATKTGTAHKDANGADVYAYATSGDIPTFRPTPVVGSFYLAEDTNIYYTWDGAALVNDVNNQPTLPITLSYAWGTEGANSLKLGNRILAPINGGGGPQDPVTGTLQEALDDIDGRLDTVEAAAGIDPNVGSSLATQVSDNTSQIAANVTDIATNASNITTLQGSANTLPVNGTNVAIEQDGANKKINIKTDATVRASVSETQAQFNVPVNLASAAKFTPASENAGTVGDITFDDDYIWVRTTNGWRKSPLYTFDATPAVSIRVTDAQYQALVAANTVDPNITYIIIG